MEAGGIRLLNQVGEFFSPGPDRGYGGGSGVFSKSRLRLVLFEQTMESSIPGCNLDSIRRRGPLMRQ